MAKNLRKGSNVCFKVGNATRKRRVIKKLKGIGVLGVIISIIGSIQENNLLLISGAILTVFSITMLWGLM